VLMERATVLMERATLLEERATLHKGTCEIFRVTGLLRVTPGGGPRSGSELIHCTLPRSFRHEPFFLSVAQGKEEQFGGGFVTGEVTLERMIFRS
jgi:hypothetical protein